MENRFTRALGIELPLIGGPMYPCSNPELVAAVSAAGGIGIIQPITLAHVCGYEFAEGLRVIQRLTDRPVGMNVLIEGGSRRYRRRMENWLDIALDQGIRFFITSLGKPDWVCARVHGAGGLVYHDVTEVHWAKKGVDCGVDGLIAVNDLAGGHAGPRDAGYLYQTLSAFGLPLIRAGGVGDENEFAAALDMGYDGVQIGTRLIATEECVVSPDYKQAVIDSGPEDIVLSERVTGVPVSLIRTPLIARRGTRVGPVARRLLAWRPTRRLLRLLLLTNSLHGLKRSAGGNGDYWQAGKSVSGIHRVEKVADIVHRFAVTAGWRSDGPT